MTRDRGQVVARAKKKKKKMMMIRSQRQVVKVERQKLAACMTCRICNNLFTDATTISECLHTFCRACIYEKITDEELDSCPVCNIHLGCAPLEKLRVDHSLEDLKAKLFHSKRKKAMVPAVLVSVPEPETVPSAPLPGRRKERSLSSLVVSTPQVSAQSVLPRKRLKSIARKIPALRESILNEEHFKKVDDSHDNLSSLEALSKTAQTKKLNSTPESSKQHKTNKDAEGSTEPCEGEADLSKPLNCLVGAISKSKLNKSDQQAKLVQMHLPSPAENEAQILNTNGNKSNVNGDENKSSSSPSGSVKARKLQETVRQKRAAVCGDLNITAQTIVDAGSKCDGRFCPIWFSLVASDDQEGDVPLPQISSCYLRVKDGSLPVSSIKKYLVQKLGLGSEAEVELSLLGQPVLSTLQLHHLVERWLRMAPTSERIQTTIGSSAKDFVMVLSYGRKA